MPYLEHTMASSISESESGGGTSSSNSSKITRTMPSTSCSKSSTEASSQPDTSIASKYKTDFDKNKLVFIRNLLKIEIGNLQKRRGALPIKDCKETYEMFSVDRNKLLCRGTQSLVYEGKNKDYPKHPVACKVYSAQTGIDPTNSMYLKFIRHLGKKHASIVHTWELFVDEQRNIEIYQEYCLNGNLQKYVEKKKSLSEKENSLYAWQLLRGMDFLGDIGIAHRDIQPVNLVLREAVEYNQIKLTNFRKAIVYWSIDNNDVTFLSCLPEKQQTTDGPNYQAPEVYGDPSKEQFDPIIADTWSYGGVIYFMATNKYPYNPTKQSENLEKKIERHVKKLKNLSSSGKDLVGDILRVNSAERMPIGFIDKSDWFNEAKKMKITLTLDASTKSGETKARRPRLASTEFRSPNEYPNIGAVGSVSSSSSPAQSSTGGISESSTAASLSPNTLTSGSDESSKGGCIVVNVSSKIDDYKSIMTSSVKGLICVNEESPSSNSDSVSSSKDGCSVVGPSSKGSAQITTEPKSIIDCARNVTGPGKSFSAKSSLSSDVDSSVKPNSKSIKVSQSSESTIDGSTVVNKSDFDSSESDASSNTKLQGSKPSNSVSGVLKSQPKSTSPGSSSTDGVSVSGTSKTGNSASSVKSKSMPNKSSKSLSKTDSQFWRMDSDSSLKAHFTCTISSENSNNSKSNTTSGLTSNDFSKKPSSDVFGLDFVKVASNIGNGTSAKILTRSCASESSSDSSSTSSPSSSSSTCPKSFVDCVRSSTGSVKTYTAKSSLYSDVDSSVKTNSKSTKMSQSGESTIDGSTVVNKSDYDSSESDSSTSTKSHGSKPSNSVFGVSKNHEKSISTGSTSTGVVSVSGNSSSSVKSKSMSQSSKPEAVPSASSKSGKSLSKTDSQYWGLATDSDSSLKAKLIRTMTGENSCTTSGLTSKDFPKNPSSDLDFGGNSTKSCSGASKDSSKVSSSFSISVSSKDSSSVGPSSGVSANKTTVPKSVVDCARSTSGSVSTFLAQSDTSSDSGASDGSSTSSPSSSFSTGPKSFVDCARSTTGSVKTYTAMSSASSGTDEDSNDKANSKSTKVSQSGESTKNGNTVVNKSDFDCSDLATNTKSQVSERLIGGTIQSVNSDSGNQLVTIICDKCGSTIKISKSIFESSKPKVLSGSSKSGKSGSKPDSTLFNQITSDSLKADFITTVSSKNSNSGSSNTTSSLASNNSFKKPSSDISAKSSDLDVVNVASGMLDSDSSSTDGKTNKCDPTEASDLSKSSNEQ